jgi:hypothetical protein
MFIFLSVICFICGLTVPLQKQTHWEPFVMGPVLICSAICLSILTVQVVYVLHGENPLMLGQIFIMWSILHMLAALSGLTPVMLTHFFWVFSSVCWQVSHQISSA